MSDLHLPSCDFHHEWNDYWRGNPEARWQQVCHCETIRKLLSTPKRQPAVHRFHPLTRVCADCNVTEVDNAAVPYGFGVDCAASHSASSLSSPEEP